jgi:hypothetical protein
MKLRFQHASWLRSTFVAFFASLLVFMAFLLGAQALGADQQTSLDKKETAPKKDKAAEPFAFADFSWLNGNSRAKESPLDTKAFTGEFRFDGNYVYDFNHPQDHTLAGSCETGRTNEIQVQQLGIGGDFHYQNVRGRLMTQFGMHSQMTPRNDASPYRGQWNLADAYRHVSEAYGGYHFDVLNGINVDLGIFMSYVGLFSYYNNDYALGQDTLGNARRTRFHSDNSLEVKYLDRPGKFLDKAVFSLTVDAGWERGGGAGGFGGSQGIAAQYFLGFMLYHRLWFGNDLFGLTLGGGAIANPGRYLVLLPPINGATAASGTPYFTQNPGNPFKAWDTSITFDYMPSQFLTWRVEFIRRAANVPYFVGSGGITPQGGNTGLPGSMVPGFVPDLRKQENRINLALLVKL